MVTFIAKVENLFQLKSQINLFIVINYYIFKFKFKINFNSIKYYFINYYLISLFIFHCFFDFFFIEINFLQY